MKKSKWSLLAMMFALMLVLAACSEKEETTKTPNGGETTDPVDIDETDGGLSDTVKNEGTAISGGTLMVAMQKEEPFQGIFNEALAEDAYDGELQGIASTNIFESDGDHLFTNDGIASFEVNEETKVVTIKIREGVKWSDGQPLTIEDVMLPYNIIGHGEYTGVRFDSDFRNIIGAEEYNEATKAGDKTATISGLVKIDDNTLELHLKDISPGLFSGGDGLLYYAMPVHQLGEVPIAELVEHDGVRKNPLSLGAFVVDKIVTGESVQYKANPYYYKGAPKLDGVIVKVVPSASIAKALEAGEYDVTLSFGATKYPEIKDLKNIDILAAPQLAYSYLGFKLGKWNTETLEVDTDMASAKMGDVELRKAMAYALNIEEVSEIFYDGLRVRANSIIPPAFSSFHDASLEGYTYDPEKANELLDAAGYADVDGDGFREDKAGKPLEIKFATMSGDDVAEQINAFWLQNWEEVGLKVVYTDGRSIEFNSFYDRVEADDPEIDVYMAAWSVGSNPSPSGVYAHNSSFNFSRYSSDTLKTTLANIDSSKSFDAEYRAEQFAEFEKEMAEVAPIVPTFFRLQIAAVNKRVNHFTLAYDTDFDWNQIELLSETGVK